MGTLDELPNPTTANIRPGSFFVDTVNGTTYVLKSLSGTDSWFSVGTASEYSF